MPLRPILFVQRAGRSLHDVSGAQLVMLGAGAVLVLVVAIAAGFWWGIAAASVAD